MHSALPTGVVSIAHIRSPSYETREKPWRHLVWSRSSSPPPGRLSPYLLHPQTFLPSPRPTHLDDDDSVQTPVSGSHHVFAERTHQEAAPRSFPNCVCNGHYVGRAAARCVRMALLR